MVRRERRRGRERERTRKGYGESEGEEFEEKNGGRERKVFAFISSSTYICTYEGTCM